MARKPGGIGRRLNLRVSKVTSRLDSFKTSLGILVIAIGAFLTYVAFVSTTGPPFQSKYQVEVSVPSDSPTVRVGQAVRIGGKLAGLISAVEPDREAGGSTVTANITKTEFRPLPTDTTAYVRVHSIVYATYLELRPGESEEDLEHGDAIAEPATSGVDLLEVVQLFDEQTRESLRDTVVNIGFGVAGRGKEANQALSNLVPLSRNFEDQIGALTSEPGALADSISGGAGTVSGLLGERDDDLAALIGSGEATFSTIAGRSEELRETIRLLRPFEDQFLTTAPALEPLLEDLTVLVDELEPTVETINAQLPSLSRLLSLGDTLRSETERIVELADPVLVAAVPVIYGLYPVLTSLAPLNEDLALLVETVEPYEEEIAQAGAALADATSHPSDGGLQVGAPSGRILPVLTCHPNNNPFPDPGEAENDKAPC